MSKNRIQINAFNKFVGPLYGQIECLVTNLRPQLRNWTDLPFDSIYIILKMCISIIKNKALRFQIFFFTLDFGVPKNILSSTPDKCEKSFWNGIFPTFNVFFFQYIFVIQVFLIPKVGCFQPTWCCIKV